MQSLHLHLLANKPAVIPRFVCLDIVWSHTNNYYPLFTAHSICIPFVRINLTGFGVRILYSVFVIPGIIKIEVSLISAKLKAKADNMY